MSVIRRLDLRGLSPTEAQLSELIQRAMLNIDSALAVAQEVIDSVKTAGV